MIENITEILEYYLNPGPLTEPGKYRQALADLPGELADWVRLIQGWMVHIFWAEREGINPPEPRKAEVNLRSLQRRLDRILMLDKRPLSETRPLETRVLGNCRDFSQLMAGILKVKGIPARARCGFGTYFLPDHYEDHWVCEYWRSDQKRWVLVDAQITPLQREVLGLTFDTFDMPEGQFIPAGLAWKLAREQGIDPMKFGIFEFHGWDFILGNLWRDVSALNNIELLPWDPWKASNGYKRMKSQDLALMDKVADLTLQGNSSFSALQAIHKTMNLFRVPEIFLG